MISFPKQSNLWALHFHPSRQQPCISDLWTFSFWLMVMHRYYGQLVTSTFIASHLRWLASSMPRITTGTGSPAPAFAILTIFVLPTTMITKHTAITVKTILVYKSVFIIPSNCALTICLKEFLPILN